MKRNVGANILVLLSVFVCGVLWLLGRLYPENFGWFSLSWAVAGVCAVGGICFIFTAFFGKEKNVPLRKINIYLGTGLLAIAICCAIVALAMPIDHILLPIIAIAVSLALLLGYVVVGGKRYDEGDNQKKGYKNYYERKVEEQSKKEEENK